MIILKENLYFWNGRTRNACNMINILRVEGKITIYSNYFDWYA